MNDMNLPRVPPSKYASGTPWPQRGCFEQTASGVGSGAVIGTFIGAIKAAWVNSPKHANIPFSATVGGLGEVALLFGAIGGVYAASSCAMASLRHKKDPFNAVVGGAFAGVLPGLYKRSVATAAGGALMCAFGAGFSDLAGGLQQRTEKDYRKMYSVNPQTPYKIEDE